MTYPDLAAVWELCAALDALDAGLAGVYSVPHTTPPNADPAYSACPGSLGTFGSETDGPRAAPTAGDRGRKLLGAPDVPNHTPNPRNAHNITSGAD